MKRIAAVFVSVCLAVPAWALDQAAQEEVFTSLTRRPDKVGRLPSNIRTITAEEIERIAPTSVADLLDKQLGVDIQRAGDLGAFNSLRMRGVPSSGQTQILIDDQPLLGASIQDFDISMIPIENIERIEIVRGGSAVLYGPNTIGGVVHIFTKQRREPGVGGKLTAETRSYNTEIYSAAAQAKAGPVDGAASVRHYETDGFQQNSRALQTAGSVGAGYTFDNQARVGFETQVVDHQTGVANGTTVPFEQWDGERERLAADQLTNAERKYYLGRLRFFQPLANGANLLSTLYGSNEYYRINNDYTGSLQNKYENQIMGNDTRVNFLNGVTVGGNYERDEREESDPFGFYENNHIVSWGAYLQDDFSLGKLDLIPALRFDQHSSFGNEYNPRLTLVYHARENWDFSANAARSYRAPKLVDLYSDYPAFNFFGNPNLQPETAVTYDLGNRMWFGDAFEIGFTGFYARIKDRITGIDTDGDPTFNETLANTPRAELSGAELEVNLKTGPLDHGLNYTYQRAHGNTAVSSTFRQLALTPRHMINYEVGVTLLKNLSVINAVQYVSRQYSADNSQGRVLHPYAVWNARVSQRLPFGRVFALVNNIADRRYAESSGFFGLVPQPGRNFGAGVEWEFDTNDERDSEN